MLQLAKDFNDRYMAGEEKNWIKGFMDPLAKILAERAETQYKVLGPFGISAAVTIYLMKDASHRMDDDTRTITIEPYFLPDGRFLFKYRTDEVTDAYRPGSIGELNGMNIVKKPLPDTIEEIEALVR